MKKRATALLLAGMMTMGAVISVSAAENENNQNPQMEVQYIEPSVYEIRIPAEVVLSKTETQANITATKMNVAPNERVQVKVSSGIENGAVTLKRAESTDTTTSTVSLTSGGEGLVPNATVALFENQNTIPTDGGTLYFSALPEDLAAGSWSGQIVFSIELAAKEVVTP